MKKVHLNTLKNKKILIGVIIFLMIMGASIKIYQDKKAEQQLTHQLMEKTQQLNLLKEQLTTLQNEESGYLAADLQSETLENLGESLKKLDQKNSKKSLSSTSKKYQASLDKCKIRLQEIETKYHIQNEVNALFEVEKDKVAINGATIHEALPITEHFDSVAKLKEKYTTVKPHNDWERSINQLLIQAENQMKDIQTVQTKLAKFFTNNEVVAAPNPEEFQEVKQDIEQIKNTTIKKNLLTQAAKVQNKIEENAKKEEQEKIKQPQQSTNEQTPIKDNANQVPEQNETQNPTQSATQNAVEQPSQESGQNPAPSTPAQPTGPPAANAFASHAEAVAYGETNFNVNGYYIVTFEGWYYVYSN